jgi:hypothetical protein
LFSNPLAAFCSSKNTIPFKGAKDGFRGSLGWFALFRLPFASRWPLAERLVIVLELIEGARGFAGEAAGLAKGFLTGKATGFAFISTL